jgi:DNA-binding NarL/FixJ family response regulator
MISIGIVDDNIQIAENLADIISTNDHLKISFIAYHGKDLLEHLVHEQPQLLILDIQMPIMNGIEAVKIVKEKFPTIKILMHTIDDHDKSIVECIILGANGYLLKNEKPEKLISAILDVMDGGAPITPSMAQKLIQYFQFNNNQTKKKLNYNLSDREVEILELIAEGLSYKLIADKLFLSVKTVGKHIEHIYAKLQVTNKVDAINILRQL